MSKDDGSQEVDNQLLQLREFCARWDGHELVAEYVDLESGTRGRREASLRRAALLDARPLQQGGIRKTIAYLERLDQCGVAFKSYTESFPDTDNELITHIVLGVTSYYAQQEVIRISDRTKAGLERARRSGKVFVRPDGFERWAPVLAGMKGREFSQGRIAQETRLSYNTIKKYLRRLDAAG